MLGKLRDFIYNLIVTAVEVGKQGDGVTQPLFSSGTEIDRSWAQLYQEMQDTREAWRLNPMARRPIGLVTGYVVGAGMTVTSEYEPLQEFINEFWHHPRNRIEMRLEEWCDELSRAGELFVTLHPNEISGMCQVRAVPASRIPRVAWRSGDHEMELAYKEVVPLTPDEGLKSYQLEGRWWLSPDGWAMAYGESDGQDGEWRQAARMHDEKSCPWMLHYAVNRPVGAVRGESDLAPILTWVRRYRRFLEDRVRLNAAVRYYLWFVQAPKRLVKELKTKYAKGPPEPGSMVIAEQGEDWSFISPDLRARDAEADGKAIRRMVATGGPGTSLVDFGDSDDASLATAKAAAELRRRFLVRRQKYFAWMLADLVVHAFNRYNSAMGDRYDEVTTQDVTVSRPDIAVEDNGALAKSASDLGDALAKLVGLVGDSPALRRWGMRLFSRFVEDAPSEDELKEILEQGVMAADGGQEADEEPEEEEEESEMAARAGDCGCKDAQAALQEFDPEAMDAIADRFAAGLAALLLEWGEKAAAQIGEQQFAAWARQVEEAGGDENVVAAAVAAAAAQLSVSEEGRSYGALLAVLLADFRDHLEVPEADRPLTDGAWIEDRTAELKLRSNAEAAMMRGLRDGEDRPNWAFLIAAGRFLTMDTRTDLQKKSAAAEARNRSMCDKLDSDGEAQAWVTDCSGGGECEPEDFICLARADVIMSVAQARRQILAHYNCTLLIMPTSYKGRYNPDGTRIRNR